MSRNVTFLQLVRSAATKMNFPCGLAAKCKNRWLLEVFGLLLLIGNGACWS